MQEVWIRTTTSSLTTGGVYRFTTRVLDSYTVEYTVCPFLGLYLYEDLVDPVASVFPGGLSLRLRSQSLPLPHHLRLRSLSFCTVTNGISPPLVPCTRRRSSTFPSLNLRGGLRVSLVSGRCGTKILKTEVVEDSLTFGDSDTDKQSRRHSLIVVPHHRFVHRTQVLLFVRRTQVLWVDVRTLPTFVTRSPSRVSTRVGTI